MTPDEMTVEDALEEAGMVATFSGESEREVRFSDLTPQAIAILAAEVIRLRAAVEAVRGLITYDAELGGYKEGGPFVYRNEVLAALEGNDGD